MIAVVVCVVAVISAIAGGVQLAQERSTLGVVLLLAAALMGLGLIGFGRRKAASGAGGQHRPSWRQRLSSLTGDRAKEAEALADAVVDRDVQRPAELQGELLVEAAREAVTEHYAATPQDVVDIAREKGLVDSTPVEQPRP